MPTTKHAPAKKSNGTMTRSNGSSRSNGTSARSNGSSTKSNGTSATRESALDKFFHDQLKDIYWAEKHLTKALPKMRKAATSEELQQAIEDHLAQTEEHVSRLEQVFELIGKKPQAKKCDGMEGLVKEGESVIEETEDGSATRDAGIITAAQKVEHYEISAYGTMVQLAKTLGNEKAAKILQTTLDEEKETDENLTQLAESSINWESSEEEEE
ncbi:MAG TPA: ferritin-like domain-containing protein [Chitinophagaceae bacterium]|jgi:ferritin-like metal-binding protein YciE|nr:ferritin-like domain-containing protein [Chitinophagaceae bacterium]